MPSGLPPAFSPGNHTPKAQHHPPNHSHRTKLTKEEFKVCRPVTLTKEEFKVYRLVTPTMARLLRAPAQDGVLSTRFSHHQQQHQGQRQPTLPWCSVAIAQQW